MPVKKGRHSLAPRRATVATAAALILMSTLAAAGVATVFAPAAAAKGKITIMVPNYQWYFEYLQEQAKAYQSRHPEVTIDFDAISGSVNDEVLVRVASGLTPDILVLGNVSDQRTRGLLDQLAYDLGPIVRKDQDIKLTDFYPTIVEAFTHKGMLVGIPIEVSTSATFANKNLFDEAGVPLPEEGWDWNDLVKIATKLTKVNPTTKQVTQWGFGADGYSLIYLGASSFLWANDADIVDSSRTTATLNRPEAIQALQFFYDIHFKNKVSYPPRAAQYQAFWNGQIAVWESATWNIAYNRQNARKDLDWDIIPQLRSPYTGKAAALVTGHTIAVTRTTKNPELAWDFIKYAILSRQGQEKVAQEGMLPPMMAAAPYYLAIMKAPPTNIKQVIRSAGFGRTAVWFDDPEKNKRIWEAVDKKWDLVMQQRMDVASFAQEAAAEVNALLKK